MILEDRIRLLIQTYQYISIEVVEGVIEIRVNGNSDVHEHYLCENIKNFSYDGILHFTYFGNLYSYVSGRITCFDEDELFSYYEHLDICKSDINVNKKFLFLKYYNVKPGIYRHVKPHIVDVTTNLPILIVVNDGVSL